MLRLVQLQPPRGGHGTGPPREPGRKSCLSLTTDERARLRVARKNLRRAYRDWDVLSSVMGVSVGTLRKIA
jgi:hypothetical protein